MDLKNLNLQIAKKLGWKERGLGYFRTGDTLEETVQALPDYTASLYASRDLWNYAAQHNIEFSMYMLLYEKIPVFMASFIRGKQQFTSKDYEPALAIARAFAQAFDYDEQRTASGA